MRSSEKSHRTLTAIMLVSVFLQGCAANFSGYAPSGPGKLEGRPGIGEIKDVLRIETQAGVQVVMASSLDFADSSSERTIRLRIRLVIPEGTIVQILSPNLVLESPEWTESKLLMIDEISEPGPYEKPYQGSRRYPPTAILHGAMRTQEHWSGTYVNPAEFTILFGKGPGTETGLPKVQSFTLRFPSMLINDTKIQIEPVRFDAYTKRGVMYRAN